MAIAKLDTNQYLLEAVNCLTKAQIELTQKLENYISESEKRFKSIDTKLSNQGIIVKSLYADYTKRLITEVAEHYKISKKDVTYDNVRDYRENSRYEHDLRFSSIQSRLWRIRYLRGVENVHDEFYSSLCAKIGKNKGQVREEPHAIAIYFKHDHRYISLYDAIELNKDYMRVAVDLIFEIEEKYGIDDSDKKYGVNLMDKLNGCKNYISEYDNQDYIQWTQSMINEYARLCKTTEDSAQDIMFTYVKHPRSMSDRDLLNKLNVKFSDNFSNNMHIILGNKELRERFPLIILGNFIGTWNKQLLQSDINIA